MMSNIDEMNPFTVLDNPLTVLDNSSTVLDSAVRLPETHNNPLRHLLFRYLIRHRLLLMICSDKDCLLKIQPLLFYFGNHTSHRTICQCLYDSDNHSLIFTYPINISFHHHLTLELHYWKSQ